MEGLAYGVLQVPTQLQKLVSFDTNDNHHGLLTSFAVLGLPVTVGQDWFAKSIVKR